jgi:hypothetical protein
MFAVSANVPIYATTHCSLLLALHSPVVLTTHCLFFWYYTVLLTCEPQLLSSSLYIEKSVTRFFLKRPLINTKLLFTRLLQYTVPCSRKCYIILPPVAQLPQYTVPCPPRSAVDCPLSSRCYSTQSHVPHVVQ